MSRKHWKPWARNLPTWLLRLLLILITPLFFVLAAWDGGIKEGLYEWYAGWKECAAPRQL